MQTIKEVLPTLVYELDWASPSEREEIMARMRSIGRQTMNLRVMKQSRLLRIRAPEDGNRIVGWAGLDAWHTPELGEFFSLFVEPEHRQYMVGLILETARCWFMVNHATHVKKVLLRMEASSNTSLLRYRLGAELMIEAEESELPDGTMAMCTQCENFKASCPQQAFLWVDVPRFIERGRDRLGFDVTTNDLPRKITLDPSRVRKERRPLQPGPPPFLKGTTVNDK